MTAIPDTLEYPTNGSNSGVYHEHHIFPDTAERAFAAAMAEINAEERSRARALQIRFKREERGELRPILTAAVV